MKTLFDIEKELKNIKLKPLTKEESNLLWSKIEQKINQERPAAYGYAFPAFNMMFKQKFAVLALSVVILIGSSFATAALANNAKPGDILFPVDLAVEKIQIVFSSNAKKSELKVKFSEERVNEATTILNKVALTTSADPASTSSASTNSQTLKIAGIEQAEQALNTAIDHLRKTKNELSQSGNQTAVVALDMAINRLTDLAKNHIAGLEKIETKIKNNGEKLKIEIKTSNNELKTKFKVENDNKGKNRKDKDDDDDDKVKIKIYTASKSHNDDDDKDDDDDDKTVVICHIPPGNSNAKQTIKVWVRAKKAHLAHGDKVGPCSSPSSTPTPTPTPTPSPTPTPDIIAPAISNITVTNLAAHSANINWNTNENSDSKVWFSISALINTSGSPTISSNTLVTNHTLSLTNLTASATYHFVVGSKDLAGNTATSSQFFFKTLQEDTTPPTIGTVSATNIGQTSASILWNTNESSTSKVWFGVSFPLIVVATTSFVENSLLVSSHLINLNGLTASKTYQYIVSSTDGAGNTSNSSPFSFITLP